MDRGGSHPSNWHRWSGSHCGRIWKHRSLRIGPKVASTTCQSSRSNRTLGCQAGFGKGRNNPTCGKGKLSESLLTKGSGDHETVCAGSDQNVADSASRVRLVWRSAGGEGRHERMWMPKMNLVQTTLMFAIFVLGVRAGLEVAHGRNFSDWGVSVVCAVCLLGLYFMHGALFYFLDRRRTRGRQK